MSTTSPPPEARLGQVLKGTYRLDRLLGTGGMGAVYQATSLSLPRRFAVKLLSPQMTQDEEVRARFLTEARIAASLQHDHIIEAFDYGETPNGVPFMVLEHLEGEDLAQRLRRHKRLSLSETVSMVGQAAGALDAAHAKGVIHRDLKPGNIFLAHHRGHRDYVKILDFGIARVLSQARITRGILGTPFYMAPEQTSGPDEEIDGRCDIFALGAVVYHCLCGRPAFAGSTVTEVICQVCMAEPPPLCQHCADLPPEVERVVLRALAKNRDDRYPRASEMWEDLKNAVEPRQGAAPSSQPEPPSRPSAFPPTLAAPFLSLRCERGERPGERYTVRDDRVLLGRADPGRGIVPEIDLSVQEEHEEVPSVSRQHAEISPNAEGYQVVDLESFNGTWVNQTRLEKGRPHPLKKGDRLRLGLVVLVVE